MLDYMLHRLPARFAISTVICAMVAATFAEGLHGTEEFVADVLGRMKLGQDIDPATLDRLVDICESALDSAPEDARAYPLFLKAARGLIDYSPDDIEGRLGVYYAQSELVKKILGRQYIIHGMSGQKKTGACPRFFFQLFWIHDNGLANCLDSAMGLDATGSLLGMNISAKKRTDWFDFNFHCFVKRDVYAYDSCSAMSSSIIKMDYSAYIAAGHPKSTSAETDLVYPIE